MKKIVEFSHLFVSRFVINYLTHKWFQRRLLQKSTFWTFIGTRRQAHAHVCTPHVTPPDWHYHSSLLNSLIELVTSVIREVLEFVVNVSEALAATARVAFC